MKNKIKDDLDLILKQAGNYIRFDGFGIVAGLERTKNKMQFYKIIGGNENELILKRYNCRRNCYLPYYSFEQLYEMIDENEFNNLPKF